PDKPEGIYNVQLCMATGFRQRRQQRAAGSIGADPGKRPRRLFTEIGVREVATERSHCRVVPGILKQLDNKSFVVLVVQFVQRGDSPLYKGRPLRFFSG